MADALRLAGWDIQNISQAFDCKPTDSIPDETIIPWCARNGWVWITADESARREHEVALKQHQVSVLWVVKPAKTGMSTAYQHAHLAAALLKLDDKLSQKPKEAIHCRLGPTLHAQPQELWSTKKRSR